MKPTSKRTPIVAALFAVATAYLLAPVYSCAQQQPATCADWTAVQRWSGTITLTGSGQGTNPDGSTYTISHSATINFTTGNAPGFCRNFPTSTAWIFLDPQSGSYSMHDKVIDPSVDINGHPCTITTSFDVDVSNGTAPGSGGVEADFASDTSGSYKLFDGFNVTGVPVTLDQSSCGGGVTSYAVNQSLGPSSVSTFPELPLPGVIGAVNGTNTIQAPAALTFPAGYIGVSTPDVTWTLSWNMTPKPPDVDVVVTIPGYSAWRPTAGINEAAVGNTLTVQAQLVSKSTGQPVTISPRQWTFALKDASSEPGVTLNWPPKSQLANPTPLDLDFNDPGNKLLYPNISISISPNGTTAQIISDSANPNSLSFALLVVDSHDWGGWATLNVTATVQGFPIKGHLQEAPGADILLPKRQSVSQRVADIWKTQNNVLLSTPDSDDSEADPDGLPGCVGDGLTLYEEYRGFMENRKHIEGDPNKKDFFIQNLIGADAEPGIWLFTELSRLNVHKDIQKDEMDGFRTPTGPGTGFGTRLINFNHGQGAHEVDQHGVFILTCRRLGGKTFLSVPGVHGRPGITNSICLQNRNSVGFFSLNPSETHAGSITPQNALVQYDVGVAHELFHSAGVDHHGDGDLQQQIFTLLPPSDPRNTTGQAVFQLNGQNVQMLREKDNTDLAADMWQNMQNKYAYWQNVVANPSQFDPVLVEIGKDYVHDFPFSDFLRALFPYVGRPHAEHSGDDRCVMRYFFANAYPSIYPRVGVPVFYNVTPGTEPVGASLCNSPAGNPGGVNDPKRPIPPGFPQPRYFDAARGDCQHQVCVNDKNPPGSSN
jgi:hypothetical protein